MLPLFLQDRIAQLTASYSSTQLAEAYTQLSQRYRHSSNKRGFHSRLETIAYVNARLPATYACVQRCLDELPQDYIPSSTLDVGCGPGTATLACLDKFDLSEIFLMEENKDIINIGQQLLPSGLWFHRNILDQDSFPVADLVLFSYVLNEIPKILHDTIVDKLWSAAREYLLIITTGTPEGFSQLKSVRKHLIQQGASIIAPCPHALECPMIEPDWCHFSVRLNRSSQHRNVKGADLAYEDEKFSYLLVGKNPKLTTYNRVIKFPQHRSGHGAVDLCMSQGMLQKQSYSKSKSDYYKILKSLEWGDRF